MKKGGPASLQLYIGSVVFFAGAGASFDSRAASPPTLLAASADLFLPEHPEFAPLVKDVLEGPGVPGTSLRGIQPEIFYEHLLSLCEDRQALALWKVLSPAWLASQGARLLPNANHLALASYAAKTGLPIFTTNFDVLFEAAADQLGIRSEVVLAPARQRAAEADAASAQGGMRLYKLHGTISLDGRDRLDTLATTMEGIAAVNEPIIDLIARLVNGRALAFVGYSGCDLDYFPAIASLTLDQRPFWFVPPGDDVTHEHARRINAREIARYPSVVFSSRHTEFPVRTDGPDAAKLLQLLKSDVSVTLTGGQKRLLLAHCLQSLGRNPQAAEVLRVLLAEVAVLEPRDRVSALLLLARVEDCLSEYKQSVTSAETALSALSAARRAGSIPRVEAVPLRARALYQRAMSRQQQIGPSIRYRVPALDWRPGLAAMLGQLVLGLWTSVRLAWMRPQLRSQAIRTSGAIRAEHAINDHALMLFGRVVSLLEASRLARAPIINSFLHIIANHLLRGASMTGDYFVYAGARKYLRRLRGVRDEGDASETYGLLRDPLNYAIVRRDAGVRRLDEGRTDLAAAEFLDAADSARACGSRATLLKALLGLASCGAATAGDLEELAKLGPAIEGKGYERFWSSRVAPFLRAAATT